MLGNDVLGVRNRIMDVCSEERFQVTVVIGPPARRAARPPNSQLGQPWTATAILRRFEHADHRREVSGGEHRRNPLVAEYIRRSEELTGLDSIPVSPAIDGHPYQNVVNSVDSEDLPNVLRDLGSLGTHPPRLANVLVAAILSQCNRFEGLRTPTLPPHENPRQYAGNAARDNWNQEGREVVVEKRIMSILGLAWRRRYYFITYALLKYEQYAKSGLLRYFEFENDLFKKEAERVLKHTSLYSDSVQRIIAGYMDDSYPHPYDANAYPLEHDRDVAKFQFKGVAFDTRAELFESVVLDSVQVTQVFQDPEIREALGGQLTSSGYVFQPYH
jgi:hypothetical protein